MPEAVEALDDLGRGRAGRSRESAAHRRRPAPWRSRRCPGRRGGLGVRRRRRPDRRGRRPARGPRGASGGTVAAAIPARVSSARRRTRLGGAAPAWRLTSGRRTSRPSARWSCTGSPGCRPIRRRSLSSASPRATNIFRNVGTVSLANIARPIGAYTRSSTARSIGLSWSLTSCPPAAPERGPTGSSGVRRLGADQPSLRSPAARRSFTASEEGPAERHRSPSRLTPTRPTPRSARTASPRSSPSPDRSRRPLRTAPSSGARRRRRR